MSARSLTQLADLILTELRQGDFVSARVLLRAYAAAYAARFARS